MEKRSNEKIIPLEFYTDGSLKKMGQCSTFGGWAFYALRDGVDFYHDSGNEPMTTNQRMELKAILEALKYAQTIRQKGENARSHFLFRGKMDRAGTVLSLLHLHRRQRKALQHIYFSPDFSDDLSICDHISTVPKLITPVEKTAKYHVQPDADKGDSP